MRVVFDSNILISALLFPGGRGEKALQRVLQGRDELLISRPIIGEVVSVLAAKFSRDREELSRVAVVLSEMGSMVKPIHRLSVLGDEPDNRILECAVEGKADLIVTGDKTMLALGRYEGIELVSLNTYLNR